MSESAQKNVPKFNGEKKKWKECKEAIENKLMKKSVLELVENDWLSLQAKYCVQANDSEHIRKMKESRLFELENSKEIARGIIRECIQHEITKAIGATNRIDPHELWSRLIRIYETKDYAAIKVAEQELERMEMQAHELVSVFAGRLIGVISELEGMGEIYNERKKIDYLLTKVQASNPAVYKLRAEVMRSNINRNPQTTFEQVLNELMEVQSEEMTEKSKSNGQSSVNSSGVSNGTSTVLFSKSSRPMQGQRRKFQSMDFTDRASNQQDPSRPFKRFKAQPGQERRGAPNERRFRWLCGRCKSNSHRHDQCRYKNKQCNICKKIGHGERFCRRNTNVQQRNPSENLQSRQQQFNNNNKQVYFSAAASSESSVNREQGEEGEWTFFAEMNYVSSTFVGSASAKEEPTRRRSSALVLDSAATSCVTNSINMVNDIQDAGSKAVVGVNGSQTPVAAIGVLSLKKAGGVKVAMNLTNTLVLPTAPVNLISLQQLLESKRVKILFEYSKATVFAADAHGTTNCCNECKEVVAIPPESVLMEFRRNGKLYEISNYELNRRE
jgi:hypothetical protein